MQQKITLSTLSVQGENGFSLDELVLAVKEAFASQGFAELLQFILRCVDETVTIGYLSGKRDWKPKPCCEQPCHSLHGWYERRLRTSLGKLKLKFRRLRCSSCGRTLVTLREFMDWERYRSKTGELERAVAETVCDQSYRRTGGHFDEIGLVPVPKSTAHRWVMDSSCDELEKGSENIAQLFADGTGYKRRPEGDKDNRGEVRVALGITQGGRIEPFGAWSSASWDEIGAQIKAKLYDEEKKESRAVEIGVSDGERGLAGMMADLANQQQRCQWHVVRDLNYTMWQEKAGKLERRIAAKNLAGILKVELPKEDFETVKEEEKAALRRKLSESEQALRELSAELRSKGYEKAAGHIEKASGRLFTYARFWLKTGVVSPRVSSWIERVMREIGRRIKKIGFGWSEEGAAKVTRILLRRMDAPGWEKYWQEKLRLQGRVLFRILSVSTLSSN
jgi:hypothetical protein